MKQTNLSSTIFYICRCGPASYAAGTGHQIEQVSPGKLQIGTSVLRKTDKVDMYINKYMYI